MKNRYPVLGLTLAIAAGLSTAHAGQLGPHLTDALALATPTDSLEVIVSFNQDHPLNADDVALLESVGITNGVTLQVLPMAGMLATPDQIVNLAASDEVTSVYLNRPLEYYNQDSRDISGVNRAVNNPAEFNRVLPFSGRGATVLINDSGIDATHPDLDFGSHVVENVQAVTNLHAVDSMLPITYLEGQIDTDTNSGHGTHCAGTVGGTGEASGGLYAGVAPGADLVGYGSGAVLFIFDGLGGFDYALANQFTFDHPIRVTSNSWGSSGDFEPLDPINLASYAAYKRGITTVFAAGNAGSGEDTHNPYAGAPWVISVGAAEKDGGLVDFSSRGKRFDEFDFTMPDGTNWTYRNELTITAIGVDVISARAKTNLTANGGDADIDAMDPAHVPFYTMISGTSMATPHVAGIVALITEANPHLSPGEVKSLLMETATNMPGREPWEVGAGFVNAYAALMAATGLRSGHGDTVSALNGYNAFANLKTGPSSTHELFFNPVAVDNPLGVDTQTFDVGGDIAFVSASAVVSENAVAIVLIDPAGNRYGSAIALPVLGEEIGTSAPGMAGTWQVQVRGIGSVSGVGVDPLGVTNGLAAPGFVTVGVDQLAFDGFTGLNDIAGHPAEGAITFGVSRRLLDGLDTGGFDPDADLARGDLAHYLMLGGATRQNLGTSHSDVAAGSLLANAASSVVAQGAALRDTRQVQGGVMTSANGSFQPDAAATRADVAFAFVQALGLEGLAAGQTGPLTVDYRGERIAIGDASAIDPAVRGHVQVALDLNLIEARFASHQGPFDLEPTITATFEGSDVESRGAYAVHASRFFDSYQTLGAE